MDRHGLQALQEPIIPPKAHPNADINVKQITTGILRPQNVLLQLEQHIAPGFRQTHIGAVHRT